MCTAKLEIFTYPLLAEASFVSEILRVTGWSVLKKSSIFSVPWDLTFKGVLIMQLLLIKFHSLRALQPSVKKKNPTHDSKIATI